MRVEICRISEISCVERLSQMILIIPISGVNPFAYELCFRLNSDLKETSHFYPFVENDVVSLNFHSFDLDSAAIIKVNSIARKNILLAASGDGTWMPAE
tara:strand:- start:5709 stop:6005 length:297 start_codon:yes stop_codon:yes gene_type:complete